MKIKIILGALVAIVLLLTLPMIPALQHTVITQEQKTHTSCNKLHHDIIKQLKQSIILHKNNKAQSSSSDNLENPTRLIQPLKWIFHILVKILFLPIKVALKIVVKLLVLPIKILSLSLKILFFPLKLFLFPFKLMIKTFIFLLNIITLPQDLSQIVYPT
jgi:hypothetical protein